MLNVHAGRIADWILNVSCALAAHGFLDRFRARERQILGSQQPRAAPRSAPL